MSLVETRCTVLRRLLSASGKDFVCPCCLKSYIRPDKVLEHCRKKDDEAHKQLASDDFSAFHSSYGNAIDWGADKRGLRLPRSRSDCLNIDTFIDWKTVRVPSDSGKEKAYATLLQIAERSAMIYLCPECFLTFNYMPEFNAHCREKEDHTHVAFRSTDPHMFLPSYHRAMGRVIREPPLGLDRRGPRSFHECFKLPYILENIHPQKLAPEE
ncbi:hypothetical protein N7492_008455 [Penicillium capsulatum]|uniref:Uncharacterized protein n=1 Tax=Penicillium capsulatum TaxID=69766 RepID=A0A9W9LH41_9EURO|nr:hypothetical protein N7492_008455 [Penicillium capsulatum]KAJ6105857.1 hypothetical protein N7512_009374 [Penicillium capsulatum]